MGLISRVSSRTYRKSFRMRSEICHFSGLAIYPGHGKTYIKADGKKVILINGKSETLLKNKKNPRKITWTILYRRKHKKGSMTEIESRKRNRRALKAQRDAAIAAAKQKKKEAADKKKKSSAAAKKAAPKTQVPKNQKQGKGAAKNFKR